MKILLSVCMLLFALSVGADQPLAVREHSERTDGYFVQGTEIRSGPVTTMLEAFSQVFNPWQNNANWPMHAYDLTALGPNFCATYGRVLSVRDLALVGRVAGGLLDNSQRYIGIQTFDDSQFDDICRQVTNPIERSMFIDVLNGYLNNVEGFGKNVNRGRLERINPSMALIKDSPTTNETCIRRLYSGALSSMHVDGHDNEDKELRWSGSVGEPENSSVVLIWDAVSDQSKSVRGMVESLRKDTDMWQFIPRNPEQIGGSFLVTYNGLSNQRRIGDTGTSLWNNGDIEWEGMLKVEADNAGSFGMWYQPPFCGVSDDDPWYLISDRKLEVDADERFRARIAPLRSTIHAVAHRPEAE